VFASTKELLKKAQKGRYAVPHFNINNLETLQGVVQAAVKLKSPVILATSEGALRYAGMDYLIALVQTAVGSTSIPIALHLDHGKDLNVIKKAIRRGYSSVMIDMSDRSFEENVFLTRKVVGLAHRRMISVEAELGTIGGAEDFVKAREIECTDPGQAKEFVRRTGCDFLAVAIGTSHGAYKFKRKAHLQIGLLKLIRRQVSVPLVLHGASGVPKVVVREAEKYGAKLVGVQGVPNSQIKEAINNGIVKINTDTDLRLAFDAAVRKVIKTEPDDFDPRHILGPARDAIQKVAEERIKLFGSVGRG